MATVTIATYIYVNTLATGAGGILLGAALNAACHDITNAKIVYADCFCGEGAGGEGLWHDTTNPFICPCDGCSITSPCVFATVCACLCNVYSFLNVTAGGYMGASSCVFSSKGCFSCTFACRKLKIPVGTNCY